MSTDEEIRDCPSVLETTVHDRDRVHFDYLACDRCGSEIQISKGGPGGICATCGGVDFAEVIPKFTVLWGTTEG